MNIGILKSTSLFACLFFIIITMSESIAKTTISDSFFHVIADKPVVSSSVLVEADLVYYKDFLVQHSRKNTIDSECFFSDQQPVFHFTGKTAVLHCKEHISRLFPRTQVIAWEQEEKKQGYILLNLPVYGIKSVRARLTAVKAVRLNRDNDIATNSNMRVVTGLIRRHVSKINTYIFKNIKDNKLMTLHATPEHLFYVKSYHRYKPINQISCNDELLASDGSSMHLICSKGQYRHCGRPFKRGWPTSVYNLEVDHTHTFFIGSHPVLVHNCGGVPRRVPDGEETIHTSATGSAEGGLREAPDGAVGHRTLAAAELAKVKHSFELQDTGFYPQIRVYSNYVESESEGKGLKSMFDNTATYFETVFSPERWTFVDAVRDKRRAFYASELLGCQYDQALKQIDFDISQPGYFVLHGITDKKVLRVLRGEESLRPDYNRYSSAVAMYDNNFWSGSHGKWISRVLDKFNFKAGMVSWYDSASNSIQIEVFPKQDF